ncbi:MAG: hypothetical protein QXU99_05055 [Candidatus Bathyarchaeia archaeon]
MGSSSNRKKNKILVNREPRSSLGVRVDEGELSEVLQCVSLKNVPLEERRKEAQKPLYLVRYE